MARAVLQIDVDTSGLSRAFGQARAQARQAEEDIRRAFGRAGAAMGGAYRSAADVAARESRRSQQAQERAAMASLQAFIRAEDQKRRALALTTANRRRAETEATRIAEEEARKRGLTAEQEARLRQRALETYTRHYEAQERRQTVIAQRESRNRERLGRDVAHGLRRGLNVGHDAAMNVARTAHTQIQDARRQRAGAMRDIGQAIRAGGGTERDVAATQTRVQAFAQMTGMSTADIAQALATGQERGSALEVRPGESSAGVVEAALRTIREANAVGINAGQMLAARGRLSGLGLQGESLQDAMRYMMRAAQLGSVEVDQIIQQGLPGASRLMADRAAALGPGATSAQRQAASLAAFRESVALQEVTAGEGNAPRNMANTLANLQSFLRTPRRQDQILTNIMSAEQSANATDPVGAERKRQLRILREEMFEADPTRGGGAMRMREGFTPLQFAARLTQAYGGNAGAAMSMLAGGGHGNAQSLLANMRGMLEFMGRRNASGVTGAERITRMMGAEGVTDTEMAGRQRAIESDALAELTRNEETRLTALTDNTSKLVQLSNAIDNWMARNPMESGVMQGLGGLVSGGIGGLLINQVGGFLGRSAIVESITAAGGVLPAISSYVGGLGNVGAQLAMGTSAAGGMATLATGLVGGGVGLAAGTILNRAVQTEDRVGVDELGRTTATAGGQQAYTNAFSADFYRGLKTSIEQAIRDGMSNATVTVSPTDAAHAATQRPAAGAPAR